MQDLQKIPRDKLLRMKRRLPKYRRTTLAKTLKP